MICMQKMNASQLSMFIIGQFHFKIVIIEGWKVILDDLSASSNQTWKLHNFSLLALPKVALYWNSTRNFEANIIAFFLKVSASQDNKNDKNQEVNQ